MIDTIEFKTRIKLDTVLAWVNEELFDSLIAQMRESELDVDGIQNWDPVLVELDDDEMVVTIEADVEVEDKDKQEINITGIITPFGEIGNI